jgi:hypothetical protein
MKLEDIIYDIRTLMDQSSEDSRLDDSFLAYKINEYRALLIQKKYAETREIDPIWLQSIPISQFTCVGTGDDPNVLGETTRLGKCTLPAVVSLPRNLGLYRMSSSSRQKQIYPTTEHEFYMMLETGDDRLRHFEYYYPIGKSHYIYPYREKGTATCILENPLEAQGKLTEIISNGNLLAGTDYIVTQEAIVYGGVMYLPGQLLTASTTNGSFYEGSGVLFLKNKLYTLDTRDDYPCDAGMAEMIIIEVLTKDFKLESSFVTDLRQDFADHSKVMRAMISKR